MQPEVPPIQTHGQAQQCIADASLLVIAPACAFGRAGIVNVAYYRQLAHTGRLSRFSSQHGGGKSSQLLSASLGDYGNQYGKSSALAGAAFDGDRALMFLDNPSRGRQAQPGARILCSEEWFKEMIHVLGQDAGTRVTHQDS